MRLPLIPRDNKFYDLFLEDAANMVAAGVYMLCRVFFLFGSESVWPGPLAFLNGWSAPTHASRA